MEPYPKRNLRRLRKNYLNNMLDIVRGILGLLIIVGTPILIIVFIYKGEQKELKDYNKKHKTNFKTIADLQNEKVKIKKAEKAKIEKEQQKEERITASEPSGGGLTSKIARLKKLYKNGTLTKAEFEKAKNNLLK
jgi:hypothetical protein